MRIFLQMDWVLTVTLGSIFTGRLLCISKRIGHPQF